MTKRKADIGVGRRAAVVKEIAGSFSDGSSLSLVACRLN